MKTTSTEKQTVFGFDLIIIALSIYVLGAMLIDTIFILPTETAKLLNYIDTSICFIFITDFIIRFSKADSKLAFMRFGWIDLISSIPMVGYLRVGRLFRLIRLVRVIRAFSKTHGFIHQLFKNRVQGAFTSVAITATLLVIFSSIAILQFETDPNSNIKTAEDAIWWAYVTVTTVGYGDKFPITTEGRIIGALLMTAGVGLFGTFTASVASWFISDNQRNTHC